MTSTSPTTVGAEAPRSVIPRVSQPARVAIAALALLALSRASLATAQVDEAAPPEERPAGEQAPDGEPPPDQPVATPPEPNAAPPEHEVETEEPASVGAPPVVPPPEAPAPAEAPRFEAVVAGVHVRLAGILHAAVIGTQGVQSFGFPTAVAVTSAANSAILANPDDGYLSFQVQQTRLGMIVGEGSPFRGQVEIDFVHFDESSPTTQAFPRLRIAVLTWNFAENQSVFLGQTWDIFGNAIGPQLLSHSFNLVGTLFQAGNIGFMRQQLGWSGRFGDLELSAAVGLQGANTGPTFNNIEESFTPTGAARAMYHIGDHGVVGVSGLGTALRFTSGMDDERRLALGGELFADLTFGPVNIHAEAYLAQNLVSMGTQNLGQGRFGADVADAGGYVSARLQLDQHSFTAMFGGAAVLNPNDVVPGYTPSATMGAVGTPNTAAGPGIIYNMTAHIGYWYSPTPGLSIVLEPYVYFTKFALAPEDAARLNPERVAWGGMLGSMFQF